MRIFGADGLCVSVEEVDFRDPNHDYGRECGVRVEVRTVDREPRSGTIYSSAALDVGPGVCRFDFLESAPHAQDRMHWHPRMADGEPHGRVFDDELRADPMGFLAMRLRDVVGLLQFCGHEQPERFAADARSLAGMADAIVADVAGSLDWIRQEPWPSEEDRDDRGMLARKH